MAVLFHPGTYPKYGVFILLLWGFVYCATPARIVATLPSPQAQLGKKLFFDTRLSATGSKSCASCHDPRFAFSDGYRTSPGLIGDTVRRNAPSLINTALLPALNWANPDLRTFEQQMLRPLFGTTPPELGLTATSSSTHPYTKSMDSLLAEFTRDPAYQLLFKKAYPDAPNGWTLTHLTTAIGAYERTLVSLNSPYDAFVKGNTNALSPDAQRGKQLFFSSQTGCANCHSGPLFTNHQYYYAGFSDSDDLGLYEYTKNPNDSFKFRTPTLRNLLFTAPYFHDGRAPTLPDVLDTPGHRIPLSNAQRLDLIFFLEALSDSTVLRNPWFFEGENAGL
jgi:cytochrome c peroxidase